jgi:hypothetical protein
MFYWPHKMHTTATKKAPTRRVMLATTTYPTCSRLGQAFRGTIPHPGPSPFPNSSECVESKFLELRPHGVLQQVAVLLAHLRRSA